MNAVARTAYYCCGVRAADAKSGNPVCGDTFAERFMTEEGRAAFSHFDKPEYRNPNKSNATRARIIDDILRGEIAAKPDVPVFIVGAGFDTRAFRLTGGRWFELDQPGLIKAKNALLPASDCPNPLHRIALVFEKGELEKELSKWAGTKDAVVVLEGVSQYLTQDQLAETLRILRTALPRHKLVCDLMNERFRLKYTEKFREELRKLGTDFETLSYQPEQTVINAGYRLQSSTSIVGRARELGAIRVPRLLLMTFFRSLRDDYRVYRFDAT
jgi:methyltransferase (TIGR00027 family)